MALKIFENLFKKESSKKNEAEIVKADTQLSGKSKYLY